MKKKLLALFLALSMAVSLVSPAVATGTPNEGGEGEAIVETTGCSECGQTEGHADTCTHYVPPQPETCDTCGKVVDECVCCDECGQANGHASTCTHYVAPVAPQPEPEPQPEPCAECGQTEGHADDCITLCTCGVKDTSDFHGKDCKFFVESDYAVVYTEEEGVYTLVDTHNEDDAERLDMEKVYNGQTLYVVEGAFQDLYFVCKPGVFLSDLFSGMYFWMEVAQEQNDGALKPVDAKDQTFVKMETSGVPLSADTDSNAVISLSDKAEVGTVITLTACELSQADAKKAVADGEEVETYTVTIKVIGAADLKCEYCQASLVAGEDGKAAHADVCHCKPVEGVHADTCPLYQAPEQIPEVIPVACTECGAETGHLETCSQWVCAECEKHECECEVILCDQCEATQAEDGTVIHEKTCPQYKLQKGDALWLKNGSLIYKDYTNADEQPYELRFSHGVTFEQEIIAEDGTVWYEFKLNSIDDLFILGYKYVKAENTSVTEPVEIEDKVEEIDGTTVTIPGVPADAVLEVKTAETPAVESENTVAENLFCFDISLTNEDGTPWTGGAVTVTLTLPEKVVLGENQGIEIAHVKGDGSIEYLEGTLSEDGMSVSFTTDSFSVFYGYTVDFEYNGVWYSIEGGSGIYLSELFSIMGIDKYSVKDVTDVVFSNPELISVEYVVNDPLEGNQVDWHLQSLAAFDTAETLTIAFVDNTEIVINVYDAKTGTLSGNNNEWPSGNETEYGALTVSGNTSVKLSGNITLKGTITIPKQATLTITGNGTMSRGFEGTLFDVGEGGKLIINGNIVIDGKMADDGKKYINNKGIAIKCFSGTVNLTGVTIKNNVGITEGSALSIRGNNVHVTLDKCIINNCSASSGSAMLLIGGGYGPVAIKNTIIENCTSSENYYDAPNGRNSAGAKAAAQNQPGELCSGTVRTNGDGRWTLSFADSVFRNNDTWGHGGGIYWNAKGSDATATAKLTIEDCQFINNWALNFGGALFNEGAAEVKASEGDMTETLYTGGIPDGGITGTKFIENVAGDPDTNGENDGYIKPTQDQTEVNNRGYGGAICQKTYNSGYADASIKTVSLTLAANVLIDNNTAHKGGGVMLYVREFDGAQATYAIDVDGATISNNTAKEDGGGAYLRNASGKYATNLVLQSGTISGNKARNGAGAYVINTNISFGADETGEDAIVITGNEATVNGGALYLDQKSIKTADKALTSVTNGLIEENIAGQLGGGIYQDGSVGTCIVSGAGKINENTAANGGGIYIAGGSELTVTGGVISGNQANGSVDTVGDNSISGQTAKNQTAGVGGGIYVAEGTFTMSAAEGSKVGIYGNTATYAADDAYASGSGTTLTLPDVGNMQLADAYQSVDSWYIDYVINDTNYPKTVFGFDNDGRYRTTANNDQKVAAIENGTKYYCLTLGSIPTLVITKELPADEVPEQSFLFEVEGPNDLKLQVVIPSSAFAIVDGKMQASVTISNLKTGDYTVTELTNWSWQYTCKGVEAVTSEDETVKESSVSFKMTDVGEETVFTNEPDGNNWLSGDCYVENWWTGNTVEKRDEVPAETA